MCPRAEKDRSRYPVCRGSLDQVEGLISVARLLELGLGHSGRVGGVTQPASFVPETLSGMELIEQFRAQSARMVMVVDEYGVVQGLLTPYDIWRPSPASPPDAHTQAWATQLPDGSWDLDGLMPVGELKARLDIDELPQEERGRSNTLAGLLMAVCGHLPVQGETIECAQWQFEVHALEGKRINKVVARKLPEEITSAP